MKQKLRANQRGFSLIEVVIAASMMSVFSLIAADLFYSQNKSINTLEARLEAVDMKKELEMFFQNVDNCTNSFRRQGNNVEYRPSGNNYTRTFDQIRIGSNDFISGGHITGYPKLEVSRMRFMDKGLDTEATSVTINGSTIPATLHYVDLEIVLNPKSNANMTYVKRVPLKIYTRNNNDRVVQCQNTPKAAFVTATMKRSMIAIQRHYCRNSIDPRYFRRNESLANCPDHNGDGEQDANGDGLCDAHANRDRRNWRAINPHPWSVSTHRNHEIWEKYFPNRRVSLAGPNLLSQNEGRCRAMPVMNDTGEPYRNIFVLQNASGRVVHPGDGTNQSEGIGCNAREGWKVLNCVRGNYGLSGDSDLSIKKVDGNDVCVTNDHYQPHQRYQDRGAWNIHQVTITATCYKLTD